MAQVMAELHSIRHRMQQMEAHQASLVYAGATPPQGLPQQSSPYRTAENTANTNPTIETTCASY